MSQWHDRFQNHIIHTLLDQSINLLETSDVKNLNQQDLASYSRLLKMTKYFKACLAGIDGELVSQTFLNNVQSPMSSLHDQIQAFNQQHNPAHLQQANIYADQVIDQINVMQPEVEPREIGALAEANKSFQTQILALLEEVRTRSNSQTMELQSLSDAVKQQIAKLRENEGIIAEQKSRLDQAIAQFQQQFSQSEASRASEFSSSVQRRNEDFSSAMKKIETDQLALLEEKRNQFDSFFIALTKKRDEHLTFLTQKEEEVKRIFNVIGNVAVAGDYGNTAERERRSANYLRYGAIASMLAMIAIASMTFYFSLKHPEMNWKIFGFRLATSVILLIPAAYLAQESLKHRERERVNRKLHLELSAIDAYLELLPAEKRQEIKARMSDKFFGQPEAIKKDEDISKHALFNLISELMKNLTKVK